MFDFGGKQAVARRVCALVCVLGLCSCSFDPYNTLLWNRENAVRNNGVIDTGSWFEWWYYKLVLPDSGSAFFFLYGVVNPWDTVMENPASRAHVSVGNFVQMSAVEQVLPVSDFHASYWATDVRVGNQRATDRSIVGNLVDGDGGEVSWDIAITKRWGFNAMGWTMFAPHLTNIFWYPAQADALFTGSINYKGQVHTFTNAPGYQDRNWGQSFPEWWVWIAANHFEDHPDTALVIGGGKPVILDTVDAFETVGVGLLHGGREYPFRPSDFDLVRVTVDCGIWEVTAVNTAGYRIDVEATAPCDSFMDIAFVTPQGEQYHDFETLTGEVTVHLYERTAAGYPRWRLTHTLWSNFAGIEFGHRDADAFDCFANKPKVLYSNF